MDSVSYISSVHTFTQYISVLAKKAVFRKDYNSFLKTAFIILQ